MLWLTWRQHRAQALVTIALLLCLGALLLASGIDATRYIADHAPPGCPGSGSACDAVNRELSGRYQMVAVAMSYVWLVGPALIGTFWGAPLIAGEFERGTHRLAWTQSVPRRRWLAVKLGVLALAVALAGAALSAMVTAWIGAFEGVVRPGLGDVVTFNATGVVPAASWLFAFGVGTAASAFFRRTLAAMAATIAIVAVTLPIVLISETYFADPVLAVSPNRELLVDRGDMLLTETWIDPTGKEIDQLPADLCAGSERPQQDPCVSAAGYKYGIYYQPASRFWQFQLTEAGILLGIGIAMGGLTVARTLARRS